MRCALIAAAFGLLAGCGGTTGKPYVVLVSIDGFRHDYAPLHRASNINKIGQTGVRAIAMLPPYPSKTFPSHYSMATGLAPENHGIVGNQFYDPRRQEIFNMSQESGRDPSWYGGTPLWTLAEQQGVHAAAFFWPASDLPIQGVLPSDYRVYDESIANETRVQQVLDWLALPDAERPHLITLYFSDVDTAGHRFGPTAPETKQAVADIDQLIGTLREGIADTGLPVNLIVVSDHGMMDVTENVIVGRESEFEGLQITPESGSQIMLYNKTQIRGQATPEQLADQQTLVDAYDLLKSRADEEAATHEVPRWQVYLKGLAPDYLRYDANSRIGEVIVMATAPVQLVIAPDGIAVADIPAPTGGAHGYDPSLFPDMQAIFYAEGPNIEPGPALYPFDNVDIYPLVAAILDLKLPMNNPGSPDGSIDGWLNTLGTVLKDVPEPAEDVVE